MADNTLQSIATAVATDITVTEQQIYDRFFYNIVCRELIAHNTLRSLYNIISDGYVKDFDGAQIRATLQTPFASPDRALLWEDNAWLKKHTNTVMENMVTATRYEATMAGLNISIDQIPGKVIDLSSATLKLIEILTNLFTDNFTEIKGVVPGMHLKVYPRMVENTPNIGTFDVTVFFKNFESLHEGTQELVLIDPQTDDDTVATIISALRALLPDMQVSATSPDILYTRVADELNYTIGEIPLLLQEGREITYRCVFNANSGVGLMPDQIFLRNEFQALELNTFLKDGYDFVSWIADNGAEYFDGDRIMLTANTTLMAQWKVKEDTGMPSDLQVVLVPQGLPDFFTIGTVLDFTLKATAVGGLSPYTYSLHQDGIYLRDSHNGVFQIDGLTENAIFSVRVTDADGKEAVASIPVAFSYPIQYRFDAIGPDPTEIYTAPDVSDLSTFTGIENVAAGSDVEIIHYGDDVTNVRLVLLYEKSWGTVKRVEHTDISSNNSQTSASGDIGYFEEADKTLIQLDSGERTLLYYRDPIQVESTGSRYVVTF